MTGPGMVFTVCRVVKLPLGLIRKEVRLPLEAPIPSFKQSIEPCSRFNVSHVGLLPQSLVSETTESSGVPVTFPEDRVLTVPEYDAAYMKLAAEDRPQKIPWSRRIRMME